MVVWWYVVPRARLTSIEQEKTSVDKRRRELPVFGIWKDREELSDIDAYVREIRRGRYPFSPA
jgi:hypothetical protein